MTDAKNTPDPFETEAAPSTGSPEASAYEPTATEHTTQDASDHDRSADRDVTYESFSDAFAAMTDGPDAVDDSAPAQYGVGPFSVREVALGAIWIVAFIVSFFPIYGAIGAGVSVWTSGIDWILTIAVPTIAVFLVGLRRLSPQGIRRVGSLGVDQFASVAFSVSAVIWLGILWNSFATLFGSRVFLATWVVWVEFILMFAGVMLTVFAPLFPTIGDDFRHRSEVPAHRIASPARPVVARPRAPRSTAPAGGASDGDSPYAPAGYGAAGYGAASATASGVGATSSAAQPADEPQADTQAFAPDAFSEPAADSTTSVETTSPTPASQAFWALAPVERPVVDQNGAELFTIGPTAWALVIEDRGDSFVVRHEDGRVGYLTDVSGVTRG